jgi:hypothetical protein
MRGDRASLGPKAIRRINRGGAAGSRPNKCGVDQKEVRESAEQTTKGGGGGGGGAPKGDGFLPAAAATVSCGLRQN